MQNTTEEKLKNRVLENDYLCNTHFPQVDEYFRGNIFDEEKKETSLEPVSGDTSSEGDALEPEIKWAKSSSIT